MKLFFLTHHKCASGWFNSINFDLFKAYGRVVYVLNDNNPNYKSANDFYNKKKAGLVAFNNADINYIETNDDFKAVHVVRDPRDIIVSAYFSHKNVHPLFNTEEGRALEEHRKLLNELSAEDGLLQEIKYSKKWYLNKLNDLSNYSSEKMLRLKLETISKDYISIYRTILRFYGLQIKEEEESAIDNLMNRYYKYGTAIAKRAQVKSMGQRNEISNAHFETILQSKSWNKMAGGRTKGETNTKSHYRKGVAGDWQNHFTEKVETAFYDSFGNILDVLGYKEQPA